MTIEHDAEAWRSVEGFVWDVDVDLSRLGFEVVCNVWWY